MLIIARELEEKTTNDEDADVPSEPPPSVVEAMETLRRLHLLAATQQPKLHSLIAELDSKLTEVYINSKGLKQTTMDVFLK